LAMAMRDGGARPLIVVLGSPGTTARRAESLGLEIRQLPEADRAQAFAELLEREQVALVNAYHSLAGAEVAARANIPFVQTIQDSLTELSPDQRTAYREA